MWQYNYDYLEHHGILGQKWGIRRYQNKDGSLTAAGKGRYQNRSSTSYTDSKEIYVDKNPKLRAMYRKAISAKTDEEKDVLMEKYKDAQIAEQNTENFKDTVKNMSKAYHYMHDNRNWDQYVAEEYMKEVVNTKAMQDFLNDKEVKKSYEKRNKYLSEGPQFDDNGDEFGPTTVDGCGIVFNKEMKNHANKFFGEYADKAYSDTNKNSNSKLMMEIIKNIDVMDDGHGSVSPYPNPLSWYYYR